MRGARDDGRRRKEKGTSGRTVAALILAGIGAVLSAAGVATFVGFSKLLDADRARVEALRGVDAAALETTPPGTPVLLEGTVSRSQPVAFRDFVAYERQQRERKEETPQVWVTRAGDTPPTAVGGVAADLVTPGTRESYLAAKAESRLVARWLGGGLVGVGGLLLLIAVVLVAMRPR